MNVHSMQRSINKVIVSRTTVKQLLDSLQPKRSAIQHFGVRYTGRDRKNGTTTSFTVNHFKSELRSFIETIECIKNELKNMQTNENYSMVKYKQLMENKKILVRLKSMFDNSSTIATAKRKINKCCTKRRRFERRIANQHNNAANVIDENQRNEQLIDCWLQSLREESEKYKREKDIKREADLILGEVKSKIADVKKIFEKIQCLQKARNVLKEVVKIKGLFVNNKQETDFEQRITRLKQLTKCQLQIYQKEEIALKTMLTSDEPQYSQSQQTVNHSLDLGHKQKEQLECLFGLEPYPDLSSPQGINNWQYYEQASHCLSNMVAIRKLWDLYLNEEGYPVPSNWVLPTAPSSESWRQYLQ